MQLLQQNNKPQRAFHDLVGLMAYCEANYAMLVELLPQKPWQQCTLTTSSGDTLQLVHLQQEKYTTTIGIQLKPLAKLKAMSCSKWVVRLYRDAKLAEVLDDSKGRQLKGRYAYPNRGMKQPDEKFRVNQHLREWLLRCWVQQQISSLAKTAFPQNR